jgi:hypothetical protein
MGYTSFEELEVCRRSARLAVKTYAVLGACRDYGLKDQMTRAAVSIASNIAEGAALKEISSILYALITSLVAMLGTTWPSMPGASARPSIREFDQWRVRCSTTCEVKNVHLL